MYKIVDRVEEEKIKILSVNEITERLSTGFIILAEKKDKQDLLICVRYPYDALNVDLGYQWSSIYCRNIRRSVYPSIKKAIESRFEKNMDVYLFQHRGEFKDFIKYNGSRS